MNRKSELKSRMYGSHSSYNHQLFKVDNAKTSQGILDDENTTDIKHWFPAAAAAGVCLCLGNEIISIITSHVDGLSCIFYLSFGSWVTGLMYQLIMSIVNYRDKNVHYIWHRNNIIIDGKLIVRNLLLFLIMCCIFFGIMCSKFMTMYFSHMSGINVGVITTIWSVQPLIAALIDWVFYK